MLFSPESIDAIGFIFSRCKITHTVHRLQYSKTSKHDEAHNGIIVKPSLSYPYENGPATCYRFAGPSFNRDRKLPFFECVIKISFTILWIMQVKILFLHQKTKDSMIVTSIYCSLLNHWTMRCWKAIKLVFLLLG